MMRVQKQFVPGQYNFPSPVDSGKSTLERSHTQRGLGEEVVRVWEVAESRSRTHKINHHSILSIKKECLRPCWKTVGQILPLCQSAILTSPPPVCMHAYACFNIDSLTLSLFSLSLSLVHHYTCYDQTTITRTAHTCSMAQKYESLFRAAPC